MKILYLNFDRGIPVLGDKGASVHVRAFVGAASRLGHEVLLVCASLGEGNPPPPARVVHLGYDETVPPDAGEDVVVRRERARIAYDGAAHARVSAALAQSGFSPDIVYERHALFHQAGVAIARALGVPRLLEVNAPLIDEQRRFRGLSMEHEARAAELRSYRGAEAVIAVSDAVGAHVAEVLGAAESVHVVPNGVDLTLFTDARRRRAAMRERIGLGSEPVIGFVGSFKAWHGVRLLLAAFASLARERPTPRLVAVGDGPEREAVRAAAEALGLADRVILPGRVAHTEVPAWLGAMDLTVAPYLAQADFYFSPMKIVESMAAACPVVAPRVGQIPDLVEDGVTGRLYPPDDTEACARAIAELIDQPAARAAMGERARERAAAFGWNDTIARILALAPARSLGVAA